MNLNLIGKVAVVTGASKGIGAGIAKALAAEGVAVAVNYANSREDADRVVASIRENGGRAIAVQADVGKKAEEALRYFPETGGNIVNISSGASKQPGPFTSIYGSTKAAVDTLTEALTKELGPRNIRVNTVAPGVTETEGKHEQGLFSNEQAQQSIIAATALRRLGKPVDVASVVVFLVSDAASWLTGERIRASGGLF